MSRVLLAAALAAALAGPAVARPVVVEMFVSQSCSSCPPADALLQRLSTAPGILPLSFNVTYWNDLGWRDTDSLQAATDRQNWYAGLFGSGQVYTPQAVVDGKAQVVGSDEAGLRAAIATAQAAQGPAVAVSIGGQQALTLTVGAGKGSGRVLLVGFDALHSTPVGGGENSDRVITEVNVVRQLTDLGAWQGQALTLHTPAPAGQHVAVLLQAADGIVLGLATR